MTNKEAYSIISEFCFTGYKDNKKPTAKLFNAIRELVCEVHENAELRDYKARLEKENTKLKAEIERLKESDTKWLNAYQKLCEKFYNEKIANSELKSELEQWESANLKLSTELIRVECEKHQLEVYKKKAQYALSCSVNAKLMDSSEISE